MIESIKQKAYEQGIQIAVLPIDYLLDIKEDIEKFKNENNLNGFQNWIVNEKYILDVPKAEFDVNSIVVTISRMRMAKAVFQFNDIQKHCIVDDGYLETPVHTCLKNIFSENNLTLEYTHWMPQKRLAVRSGLCEYGRNNITYCDDWGSFIRIGTYVSDALAEEHIWHDVMNMEICKSCKACINSCPTKAILPDRFLIDNEICLANLNCIDGREIPKWVPVSAHHKLIDCTRCQDICPMNQKPLAGIETIVFTQAETDAMLHSQTFQDFPDTARKKLWYYDNGKPFQCIPRNLRLMFGNV